MTFILKWLIPVKIVLSAAQLFGQDAFDIVGIDKRVSELETQAKAIGERIDAIEKQINALGNVAAKCPCPDGPCLCDDDCDCPDCPKHQVATENAFSGTGLEVVVFGATWCKFCPDAKKAAEACGVPYIDVDKRKDLADRYNVDSLPQIVRFQDGNVRGRFVGSSVNYSKHIRDFQNPSTPPATVKTASRSGGTRGDDASDDQIRQHLVDAHGYSWSQVSGMNRFKAAHDRGHGGPARVSLNYPIRRQPTVRYQTYQPRVYYQQSFQSSCPNCVRR